MDTILWIVLAALLLLDLLVISLRTGLVNTRLPQLIDLSQQKSEGSLEPALQIFEKVSLRVALRFALESLRLLMAVSVYFLLAFYFPRPSFGLSLGVIFVAGLLVLSIEFAVEGGVRRQPEAWLVRLTPLARVLDLLLRPFSVFFLALLGKPVALERFTGQVTEDELKTWVEAEESAGGLEKGEREMIYSIFHFGDTLCREIMVPRIDILALEASTSVPEAVRALTASGHSRVPVYEETIDNIAGLLYAKDLLRASQEEEKPENIRPFLRPAYFVPEAKKVDELLREMQERSIHMAVVVDEYGGTEGIITLEDILEELVGEIWDEHDEATEDFRRQSDGSWIVLGSAGVDDLYERLGLPEDEDIDSNTVNGLVQEKTCHLPKVGDRFTLGEYDGVVTRTAKRRVTEVRLTPADKPEVKKDEEDRQRFNRITNK